MIEFWQFEKFVKILRESRAMHDNANDIYKSNADLFRKIEDLDATLTFYIFDLFDLPDHIREDDAYLGLISLLESNFIEDDYLLLLTIYKHLIECEKATKKCFQGLKQKTSKIDKKLWNMHHKENKTPYFQNHSELFEKAGGND